MHTEPRWPVLHRGKTDNFCLANQLFVFYIFIKGTFRIILHIITSPDFMKTYVSAIGYALLLTFGYCIIERNFQRNMLDIFIYITQFTHIFFSALFTAEFFPPSWSEGLCAPLAKILFFFFCFFLWIKICTSFFAKFSCILICGKRFFAIWTYFYLFHCTSSDVCLNNTSQHIHTESECQ